jgi:hypothetical protein
MRIFLFLVGLVMFLVGAVSNFSWNPLPFNCRAVPCSVGPAVFTLDVVMMVVGVFIMIMVWVLGKLVSSSFR